MNYRIQKLCSNLLYKGEQLMTVIFVVVVDHRLAARLEDGIDVLTTEKEQRRLQLFKVKADIHVTVKNGSDHELVASEEAQDFDDIGLL